MKTANKIRRYLLQYKKWGEDDAMSDDEDFRESDHNIAMRSEEDLASPDKHLNEALSRLRSNDGTLTSLNLTGDEIGTDKARELARIMRGNRSLARLNLSYDRIGLEAVRSLADALKGNETLTHFKLSLRERKIGTDKACSLLHSPWRPSDLSAARAEAYRTGAEGARALADALKENRTLTNLILWENNMGAAGAGAFADAMGGNGFSLKKLQLVGNRIGDEGARTLAHALEGNNILTHLDIRRNTIGDEGACALANSLKENSILAYLNLGYNEIGDGGAREFGNCLRGNSTVTNLDLEGNEIGSEGARALVIALKGNSTLSNLNLWLNQIGAGGSEIAQAEREIGELTSRNKLYQLHCDGVQKQGVSFYFGKNDDGDAESNLFRIKETVWKAATAGDGLVLKLVQHVLQEYLRECDDDDNLTLEQISLKKLFDKSRSSEGSPLLHLAAALDSEEALNLCQFLVGEIGADFDTATDGVGRTVRDIAQGNARASKWAKSVGTFLGRYFIEERGQYKSATCTVHFAIDVEMTKGDPDRNVAIKIMDKPEHFEHELSLRLVQEYSRPKSGVDIHKGKNRFSEDHVVPLLRYHVEGIDGSICRCLVLVKGQRSLDEVLRYEGIAGHDINAIIFFAIDMAQALQHLHSYAIIHGDFKPRNIVRIHGDYKLIDFDASIHIGGSLTEKISSGYTPPEVAEVIFRPEESEEDLFKVKEQLEKEMKDAAVGGDFVALSEINDKFKNVNEKISQIESSPCITSVEKPRANAAVDIWSYGVVMYQMLTGKSLFSLDSNDNLSNGLEVRRLVQWGGITDSDLSHVLRDCEDQGLVDSAKDLLRKCLSTEGSRLKSFNGVLDHPFLTRKRENIPSQQLTEKHNSSTIAAISAAVSASVREATNETKRQMQEIKKGQQEIKEGQQEIKGMQKMMALKIDKTLSMLHEMQTQLCKVSTIVNKILLNFGAPKLLCIAPVDPSRKDWFRLSSWAKTKVRVIFICPVTYSIPRDAKNKAMGYTIRMPKDWVLKYGPALKLSFEVLQIAFAVGRLACLPLPDISGSTNPFRLMNDDLMDDIGDNVPDITALAGAMEKRSNPTNELTESMRKKINASYDQVKRIAEDNGDPDFLKTGLSKVKKDECVEYVLNDPNIKALYEEKGQDCVGLTILELKELGADLDVVVKEGELEKNSKCKQDNFIPKKEKPKEKWKQSYFVLRKSGSLTYYPSKEERDKDPLGASGKTKPKRVVQIEECKNGCFKMSYEDGTNQIFKVPLAPGEIASSNRELAKTWVDAWVNKAKACYLSEQY